MRIGPVVFFCGIVLSFFGILMLVPAIVDFICHDKRNAYVFIFCSLITLLFGALCALAFYGKYLKIRNNEIFFITSLIWIVVSVFSALPFYLGVEGFTYASAFFESISGLTTTGASVMENIEAQSRGILLWRSLLQWIGGVGIVVLGIFILPMLRVGGMQLFMTEASDRYGNKAVPTMRGLVNIICMVYLVFTVIFTLLLWLAEMNFFDALNHSFTAISTGGYSTRDASIGHFERPITHWILSLEMLVGSLPFIFLFYLLSRNLSKVGKNSQALSYLSYVAIVWGILTFYMWCGSGKGIFDVMTSTLVNVVSFSSTTGFKSVEAPSWHGFPAMLLLFMVLVGGCTGSTAGGIKIFRLQVVWMVARKYMDNMLHPHRVIVACYNGKKLEDDAIIGVLVFIAIFFMMLVGISVILTVFGIDLVTALSATFSCLANNGVGVADLLGKQSGYSSLPDVAKWILSFAMLAGRLEFLTVLILFLPETWKKR